MKNIEVLAYPYASQIGTINIPDSVKPENMEAYIREHRDEIKFGEPELDYRGTDFEFYGEDD